MKCQTLLVLLIVLFVGSTSAQQSQPQVKEGPSSTRLQMLGFLMSLYRLPKVQEGCEHERTVSVKLEPLNYDFDVECDTRRDVLKYMLELYKRDDVTKACTDSPSGWITVRVFGSDTIVDCKARAADLKLFEDWLKPK